MMGLRVVLALAFLGITTWFQIREFSVAQINFHPLYAIVIIVGLITIIYSLLFGWIRNLSLFAYIQLAVDIALVTLIVYVTGGTESYLPTLYPLTVIAGTILLNRRGGFFSASVSSIAYGVLIDMDFYGMLPFRYKVVFGASVTPAWEDVLTTVATNILAFFTVAYLTGYLAERTAKVEEKLKEREIDFGRLESLNRHIVENITSGIMTLDEEMRITSFNKEAENVTGYTLREVYYSNINEIFPEMMEAWASLNQPAARPERRFKKKDGQEIFLGFTISEGQGGDVKNIIIFQDLTKMKAMEEQLRRDERLKALGELSIGIAHEIRNPLASISGSIQVLKEDLDLSGEDSKLMEIVLRETDRLNLLITDYLLFARPAQGKRELVNLTGIISETVKMFGNSPEAARVEVENSVEDEIYVDGDPRQLGQVFWNLIINSAHAMKNGGKIKISSRFDYGPHVSAPSVELKLADTGEGIKPEHLNRIFDPFFSTKDSGTGLGLAIVHRIIESHGGSIEVKSALGRGAVFKLRLPLSESGAIRNQA